MKSFQIESESWMEVPLFRTGKDRERRCPIYLAAGGSRIGMLGLGTWRQASGCEVDLIGRALIFRFEGAVVR
jgi:hypothetical protein